jgi:hypothetical protein
LTPARNSDLAEDVIVLDTRTSGDYVTYLVRLSMPIGECEWEITEPTLEEIILPYLRQGANSGVAR